MNEGIYMKIILVPLVLFFTSAGFGAEITCEYSDDILSKRLVFSAAKKAMVGHFKVAHNQQAVFSETKTYLNEETACMEKANVAQDCTFSEHIFTVDENLYDFQFTCKGGQSGELVYQDKAVLITCTDSQSKMANVTFSNCEYKK